MDLRVAVNAGLRRRRPLAHSVNRALGNRAVALRAQRVDTRHGQQSGVLRAMWSVASHATFRFDRGMLIHEGPALFSVALGADLVLIGSGPQVVVAKSPVRIVAIGAADHTLIHLVMERHAERRLDVRMALETERGLRCQQ